MASTQNVLFDARARELAATDLDHSYCVEAAAGTGKTTLLVARLLEIITRGKAELKDVVAITFTRKAAAELKVRLREELEKRRQTAAEPESALMARALEQLDRASISTIHSFAASLLRQRPVEAGVDPGFEELDEMGSELLFEEVWQSWKERQMLLAPPILSRLLALEIGLDTTIRDAAAALFRNRDLLRPITPLPNPVNELWGEIESKIKQLIALRVFCSDGDRGGQQIDRLSALLHQTTNDELDRERALRFDLEVKKNYGANANWKNAEANQRQKKLCAEFRELQEGARARLGPSLVSGAMAWLQSFLDQIESTKHVRGQLDFEDLLLKARDLVRDHLEVREYFQRQIKFLLVDEFQDTDPLQMELVFYLAEQRPEARAGSAGVPPAGPDCKANPWDQVKVAPGKLMLVGDPKQSIYKFRRADIQIYDRAKRSASADGEVAILQQNFRSAPAVLSAVNKLFAKQMIAGEYQAAYVDLLAPQQAQQRRLPGAPLLDAGCPDAAPGVALLFPPKEYEPGSMSAYREAEAELIARFIVGVCSSKTHICQNRADLHPSKRKAALAGGPGVGHPPNSEGEMLVVDKATGAARRPQPRDIAVLFPVTTGLEFYEDALQAAQVPFQLDAGKQFYARREIRALIAVLKAVDNPEDAISVVAALRSPLLGMSDDDLFLHRESGGSFHPLRSVWDGSSTRPSNGAGQRPAPHDTGRSGWHRVHQALQQLREWHELRPELSICALIERVLHDTAALQFFALLKHGEQAVANLLRISDLARDFEGKPGASLRSFVSWLARREDAELAEAETAMRDEEENAVQMLTIHAAKGLEFPIVILANLASSERKRQKHYINHSRGEIALDIGGMTSANFESMAEEDRQRSEAEDVRLLYVGFTRARDCIVIPRLAPEKTADARFLGFFSEWADSLGERPEKTVRTEDALLIPAEDLPDIAECDRAARMDLATPVEEDRVADILRERDEWAEQLRALGVGRQTHICQNRADVGHPPNVDPARTSEYRQKQVHAIAMGTAFHRVMAAIDFRSPQHAGTVVERIAGEEGVEAATLAEWVAKTLDCGILQRAAAARRRWRELPFCALREGQAVEGSIDLLFEEEDGLVLVDYKTDSVTAANVGEAAELHRPQLQSYARALEAIGGRRPKEIVVLFVRIAVAVVCDPPKGSDRTPQRGLPARRSGT